MNVVIPIYLAHGALGVWDEVIFLSIAAIFLIVMAVAWVKSRNTDLDPEDSEVPNTEAPQPQSAAPSERFKLD